MSTKSLPLALLCLLIALSVSESSCAESQSGALGIRLAEPTQLGATGADQEEWPPTCGTGSTLDFEYVYPAGNSIVIRASARAQLVIPVDEIRSVIVVESRSPVPPYTAAYEARVIPNKEALESATKLRSRCPAQRILVTIDGDPVWIEPTWTTWDEVVPGGVFGSWKDASEAYSDAPVEIERVPLDEAEYERQRAEYEAQQQADLWRFVCDKDHRERVRAASPEDYDKLMERRDVFEAIDCGVRPSDPRQSKH